ncbi:MAG: hypothetical protein PHV03_09785 [Desulfitobacteriaceae bacterium]|nr:hypothetical protein [Desulfitobacteriaceae bacterium]
MYKRIIAMLLSLILMLGVSGVNVSAATPEGNNKALRLSSGGVELFVVNVDNESINSFNTAAGSNYLDYELILANKNDLPAINSTMLVELIDNGATLLVEDSDLSLKEIAKELNLNEPDDRFVKGAQVQVVSFLTKTTIIASGCLELLNVFL